MTAFVVRAASFSGPVRDSSFLNMFPLKNMQTHFPLAEKTGRV